MSSYWILGGKIKCFTKFPDKHFVIYIYEWKQSIFFIWLRTIDISLCENFEKIKTLKIGFVNDFVATIPIWILCQPQNWQILSIFNNIQSQNTRANETIALHVGPKVVKRWNSCSQNSQYLSFSMQTNFITLLKILY